MRRLPVSVPAAAAAAVASVIRPGGLVLVHLVLVELALVVRRRLLGSAFLRLRTGRGLSLPIALGVPPPLLRCLIRVVLTALVLVVLVVLLVLVVLVGPSAKRGSRGWRRAAGCRARRHCRNGGRRRPPWRGLRGAATRRLLGVGAGGIRDRRGGRRGDDVHSGEPRVRRCRPGVRRRRSIADRRSAPPSLDDF